MKQFTITIEDIALPGKASMTPRGRGVKSALTMAFEALEPGQSFFLPDEFVPDALALRTKASIMAKKLAGKFSVRVSDREGESGFRIYRTQ